MAADKAVHVVLDNDATQKHPRVKAWSQRHPRVTFHFTPTSCSWANAVEGWFAKLTSQRLKRGVFTSIVELQAGRPPSTASSPRPTPNPHRLSGPNPPTAAVNRGRQA